MMDYTEVADRLTRLGFERRLVFQPQGTAELGLRAEDWLHGGHGQIMLLVTPGNECRVFTEGDAPGVPTPARMNQLWREMMTWPVPQAMNIILALAHAKLDQAGKSMIDAGLFDHRANRDVYAVVACGQSAARLKEAFRASSPPGTREILKAGEQQTPLTEPLPDALLRRVLSAYNRTKDGQISDELAAVMSQVESLFGG